MNTRKSRPSWLAEAGVRTTPEMGRAMVQALEESGLSSAAFCREHRIPVQRMCYWRQRLREMETSKPMPKAVAPKKSTLGFATLRAQATPDPEAGDAHKAQRLDVTLANGTRIVLHGPWDESSTKACLEAFASAPC